MCSKSIVIIFLLAMFTFFVPDVAIAQSEDVKALQYRVSKLERAQKQQQTKLERVEEIAKNGAPLLFMMAVFCALWAQNTGRSAWGWFFLGLFFNVFALLFVLAWNDGGRNITTFKFVPALRASTGPKKATPFWAA